MAIVVKTVNGYGPYEYRVTYEDGKHHWEYIGRAGEADKSSSTKAEQSETVDANDDDSIVIEDVRTYSDGSPQIFRDELAEELGIDPDEITSIKSVTGEGKEEFSWVDGDSIINGRYEVYVDSNLTERVRVRKDGSGAELTTHDTRRALTSGLPRTSWREAGFDSDYEQMVGTEVEMQLDSGEIVTKELVTPDDSESSEQTVGLGRSGYTAIVDDGSIKWTDSKPVYAKNGILLDVDKTDVESIEITD